MRNYLLENQRDSSQIAQVLCSVFWPLIPVIFSKTQQDISVFYGALCNYRENHVFRL